MNIRKKVLLLSLTVFSSALIANQGGLTKQAEIAAAEANFDMNLHIEGKYFITQPVKYVWNGKSETDTYDLMFFDVNGSLMTTFADLVDPEYTLYPDYDGDIENEYISIFIEAGLQYSVMVVGYQGGGLSTYYSDIVTYDYPPAMYAHYYESEDYRGSFQEQYFFDEKVTTHTRYHFDGHIVDDGFYPYQIKRLRTATIDNKYVVLSPRRAGAGLAYIEYDFDYGIDGGFEIDLALWSGSELLRASDCTAIVQYRTANNVWVTAIDLLNDVQLPVGKDNLKTFFVDLTQTGWGDGGIRVVVTSPAIGSSKNTGRLVVGGVRLFQFY